LDRPKSHPFPPRCISPCPGVKRPKASETVLHLVPSCKHILNRQLRGSER
jgi:hypothetical protein